jgi:hypothetical protein
MLFRRRPRQSPPSPFVEADPVTGLSPLRQAFLEECYLQKPYIVPEDVRQVMEEATGVVRMKHPNIACVVHVGSTATGSLALRRLEGRKTATDLDFYLVGRAARQSTLDSASEIVGGTARLAGLALDSELNGRRPGNYLNLDNLEEHIDNGDFGLLALPFCSAFGAVDRARRQVAQAIIYHPNGREAWDEVANHHISSLSMYHESWPQLFADTVSEQYYPRKITAFQLPESPIDVI